MLKIDHFLKFHLFWEESRSPDIDMYPQLRLILDKNFKNERFSQSRVGLKKNFERKILSFEDWKRIRTWNLKNENLAVNTRRDSFKNTPQDPFWDISLLDFFQNAHSVIEVLKFCL